MYTTFPLFFGIGRGLLHLQAEHKDSRVTGRASVSDYNVSLASPLPDPEAWAGIPRTIARELSQKTLLLQDRQSQARTTWQSSATPCRSAIGRSFSRHGALFRFLLRRLLRDGEATWAQFYTGRVLLALLFRTNRNKKIQGGARPVFV